MGREIPASSFERGDSESRTWDEMGWWEQPYSADDEGYADDEDLSADDEEEEDDSTTLEDWLAGWREPLTADRERWLLSDLDGEVRDLGDRIYYRDMAAGAGDAVDADASVTDKNRLARLTAFRRDHPDPAADVDEPDPPAPTAPPASVKASPPSPVRMVEAAIKEKLTASEMLHWQELQKGTKQTVIAGKLGIKQGAVSKREAKLRERINAISIEMVGRPYPAKHIDRGLWARQGRRRGIKAPPGSDK